MGKMATLCFDPLQTRQIWVTRQNQASNPLRIGGIWASVSLFWALLNGEFPCGLLLDQPHKRYRQKITRPFKGETNSGKSHRGAAGVAGAAAWQRQACPSFWVARLGWSEMAMCFRDTWTPSYPLT